MVELGKIKLAGPLVLAPIAGFTDSPFRKICVRHGCGLTMTELISAEGIVRRNRKTMDLLKFTADERPFAIQIFGKKPETLAAAAEVVESLSPDIIDINMGCPARKVVGSGNGASLLRDPLLVAGIAEAVVKATKLPVSAKIRIGWDSADLNYMDVVKALEGSGISMIIVHGRTREQQYSGKADWNIIREIRERASVPVIGNGDIDSFDMARERMEFSGCPAVMIGRGAIGNPWIFSGRKPELHEIIETVKLHLDLMLDEYGNRGIHMMRKHIVRYIHGTKNAARVRSAIVRATGREEIRNILDDLEGAE